MCVVGGIYTEDHGWIIFKNRDRNYKPIIRIRTSYRKNIERLYIWDEKTKYTEGVNEYGVAIVSSSVTVKDDESEVSKSTKVSGKVTGKKEPRAYYNPEGLRIRTALFEKDAVSATNKLIELEIPGNTIIADAKRCFILEGVFVIEDGIDEYVYEVKEVPKDHIIVRTNHGILLPWTGYDKTKDGQKDSRLSSDNRYDKVVDKLKHAKTLDDVLEVLSQKEDRNPQMNPLRHDETQKAMRTTGQILIVPKDKTLHYRPVWCDTKFDLEQLNDKEKRTFFEIISTRKLASFKEQFEP